MNKDKNIPFTDSVFYRLSETARITELIARNFYKNHFENSGIIFSPDDFKILSHIMENPALSQSDISKLVYKGKAHIGKILNELEKRKYIKRVLSTKNNIMVKHTIVTEEGKKLYEETFEKFQQFGHKILAGFEDEEIVTLNSLLDKLKNIMLKKNEIYF